MKELNVNEVDEVSGAGLWPWLIGHFASNAANNYWDFVHNGAGGWSIEYTGQEFADPLL